MDAAAPPHQRQRPKGMINIIAITFCLCCIFVILSLFVLDYLAKECDSLSTFKGSNDITGVDQNKRCNTAPSEAETERNDQYYCYHILSLLYFCHSIFVRIGLPCPKFSANTQQRN
mmetsp:Transcript_23015/g.46068  ORF Transcript_23015/g.46068 Transcript_23015/m.46068 type:complete len:116 (+) Transcript_23015:46-393(+)